MPQWVITEAYRVAGTTGKAFGVHKDGELSKALSGGWRIIQTSSTHMAELYTIYVTYVLEKQEQVAEPTPPYKGLL